MFVVTAKTLKSAKKNNFIMVSLPFDEEKNKFKKITKSFEQTFTDICADLLQLRIGDFIYFWERSSHSTSSRVHGIYVVTGHAYYDKSPIKGLEPHNKKCSRYPFRIPIALKYNFKNPIMEYELLNDSFLYSRLWNISGKKIGNKSRSNNPLTHNENQILFQKLINLNQDYEYIEAVTQSQATIGTPITFNRPDKRAQNRLLPKTWGEINFNDIPVYKADDSNFIYEKTIEAYFNENIDNSNQIKKLFPNTVTWFANYLPYSLDSSEIDYLVFESIDGINLSKISVLEFQTGALDSDHIRKAFKYGQWVAENLLNNCTTLVNVINIYGKPTDSAKKGLPQVIAECKKNHKLSNYQTYIYEANSTKFTLEKTKVETS